MLHKQILLNINKIFIKYLQNNTFFKIFLLPSCIPHSPQRFPNTLGLVSLDKKNFSRYEPKSPQSIFLSHLCISSNAIDLI